MESLQADIEVGQGLQNRSGYRLWAAKIASDPDNEPLVFRKFDDLGALNLLCLQGEMLAIESQLEQLDAMDVEHFTRDSAGPLNDWDILVSHAAASDDEHSSADTGMENIRARSCSRMKLIKQLRNKIKEYHEALLLQSEIAQLKRPSKRVLDASKSMFHQDGCPVLEGRATDYLSAQDLVALKPSTQDPISNYLRTSKIARSKSSPSQSTEEETIYQFAEQRITLLVTIITILISAIFLVGPILALYFTRKAPRKLAIALVFTAGFALSVSLITSARRAEIFVGTATYAAVMVVFITGDLSGSDPDRLIESCARLAAECSDS